MTSPAEIMRKRIEDFLSGKFRKIASPADHLVRPRRLCVHMNFMGEQCIACTETHFLDVLARADAAKGEG